MSDIQMENIQNDSNAWFDEVKLPLFENNPSVVMVVKEAMKEGWFTAYEHLLE